MTPMRSLLLLVAAAAPLAAQPLPVEDVPAPLRPWTGWVLDGARERLCPAVDGAAVCLWPGRLSLQAGAGGASFAFSFEADREIDVPLPGGDRRWPQGVTLDGQPAVVLASSEGRPLLRVGRGAHRVEGRFTWERLPDSLPVPGEVGLLDLTVDGGAVPFPRRDQGGLLSLRQAGALAGSGEELQVRVFRKLSDGIPLTVETRLVLDVSGRAREVALRGALPTDAQALSVAGELPARLDADGRLRVQVRAGSFTVSVTSRFQGRPERFGLPETGAPWPVQEVWVFEAAERLRQVQVGGAPPIDPSRTDLPETWRQLPAFLMEGQAALTLEETRRGEPEAAPDQVSLARRLWLDQDGGAFTVRDAFSGELGRTSRLDLAAPGELGRVQVGREGQLVTQDPRTGRPGVELRQVQLAVEADSRLARTGALPAVGWNVGVQSLRAVVHLPPGWRLLAATGVDRASGSWASTWNLYAFFFVLITALAAHKLLGWRAALLTLATLVLLHGESDAPRLVWLSLLAALGLRRVSEARALRIASGLWLGLSLLALAWLGIPFLVDQVRGGLFPQVVAERGASSRAMVLTGTGAPQTLDEAPGAPPPLQADAAKPQEQGAQEAERLNYVPEQKAKGRGASSGYGFQSNKAYRQDPHAVIQTGAGVPSWSWGSHTLTWSGPVAADQRMRLLLLSPFANLCLSLLRVLLTLALSVLVLASAFPAVAERLRQWRAPAPPPAVAVALLAALLGAAPLGAQETPAENGWPGTALLEQLQERLLRPAACAPDCLTTARLALVVEGSVLRLEAEVHAGARAAWPLPGPTESWVPSAVSVDGRPAEGRLARLGNGFLHLRLDPGVHVVRLSGALPPRDSVTLQFGEKPRRATASASGWQVDGIREDGSADDSVQLSRRLAAGAAGSAAEGAYAPWLEVTRVLDIGVTWDVETIVRRVSPAGSPLLVKVPLLEGMLVTGDQQVKDGELLVNLGRDETEARWSATLPPAEGRVLTLAAPENKPWSEVWVVRCGLAWQCQAAGLPPVSRVADGSLVPEYRPWPGERLTVAFSRPTGVAGQTLTIDSARLRLSPGVRLEDATLDLSLRASRTTPLTLTLPQGAEVQQLQLGGSDRPIRPEGSKLTLTIGPGQHALKVAWRRPGGLGLWHQAARVDLGQPAVNAEVVLQLPAERWLLLTGGPAWGPAVLFWGYLLVIVALALLLARAPRTPLSALEWTLLALGLTQIPLAAAALVAGWFLVLAWRQERVLKQPLWHNLLQLTLVGWTFVALVLLYAAVYQGLLVRPDMLVAGAGSSATELRWYQDRVAGALPQPWALSLPLWAYRVAMLLWSLWLSLGLLRWVRWAWASFTSGTVWARGARPAPASPAEPAPSQEPPGGEGR